MLIGLCGAAGSGKDTVAEILRDIGQFYRVAFADPIYEMVSTITGLLPEDLHDREIKELPIDWIGRSPRQLLQTLGTEWGRHCVSETLWVDIAMRRVEQQIAAGRSVVITDVRFDNEAAAVKAAGGQVWQVVRSDGCVRGAAMLHASEAGVSPLLVRYSGDVTSARTLDARHRLDVCQHGFRATGRHDCERTPDVTIPPGPTQRQWVTAPKRIRRGVRQS